MSTPGFQLDMLAFRAAETGVQDFVNLGEMRFNWTMMVSVDGDTGDDEDSGGALCSVMLEVSHDTDNWFGAGTKNGPGIFNRTGLVAQFARANIISLQSGHTATITLGTI